MIRWIRRLPGVFLLFALMFAANADQALAVALGDLDVASHLGEPFYAEVPLRLARGEQLREVTVEPASPSEYRMLEVYRDPALNAIRVDIKNDARGARVELRSDSPIESPFFNLVLRVRHGHATHFKKFPVFLDLPEARPASVKSSPTVSAVKPRERVSGAGVAAGGAAATAAERTRETASPAFKPYDGWARIGRSGPLVHGATISTVARRLRVDGRYTMAQVIMALFYKNRRKFEHDNVNLVKAGVYLDVPKAREVEAISPARARQLLAEHNRVWERLKQQPRYAAEAEAQKNRYKARVRVGKAASGVAAAPATEAAPATAPAGKSGESKMANPAQPVKATGKPTAQGGAAQEAAGATGLAAARVKELERQNAELRQKLKEAETRMAALATKPTDAEAAAANARLKRLQLRLVRLQAELARRKQAREEMTGREWMLYGMGGLVVVLLAVVGWLLSRMRRLGAPTLDEAFAGAPEHDVPTDREQAVAEVRDGPVVDGGADDAGVDVAGAADHGEPDATTGRVPDLTESDTAEMEPFLEKTEEEPDPDVDYLAEADVYLRYGMEEEALRQLRLAIRQRPDNPEAHARLVRTLKASGDEAAAEEAVARAREVLAGDALNAFEAALVSDEEHDAPEESAAVMDETVPAPDADMESLDFGDVGSVDPETETDAGTQEAAEADGAALDARSDMDLELDLEPDGPSGDGVGGTHASDDPGHAGTHDGDDLSGMELTWPSIEETGGADGERTAEEDAGDLDVTGLDWGEASSDVEEARTHQTNAGLDGAGSRAEDADDGSLDLTGIDLPDFGITMPADDGQTIGDGDDADPEKTIAVDWSEAIGALEELTGPDLEGAGTSEGDDGDGKNASGEDGTTERPASAPDTGRTDVSGSRSLDDDMEDDFASTMQLTAADLADADTADAVELDATPEELSVDMDGMDLPGEEDWGRAAESSAKEQSGGEPAASDDDDYALELDSLLAELNLEDETPSPETLDADRAKSLLAEAESAIDSGDAARARELLGEAEAVIDDADREWLDFLKGRVGQ